MWCGECDAGGPFQPPINMCVEDYLFAALTWKRSGIESSAMADLTGQQHIRAEEGKLNLPQPHPLKQDNAI